MCYMKVLLCDLGIDSSDDDASDNEEIFPWQCGVMSTFSESDDEAHEDDE